MTSLLYGDRVKKSDPRVEAYGTCDEANSSIGLALSFLPTSDATAELRSIFHHIQTTLFHIGAQLATPQGKPVKWTVTAQDITRLEQAIDTWEAELTPLQNFILPGGSPSGAALHVARTITRRAERLVVELDQPDPLIIQYLNRLSDLLFVAARYVNQLAGEKEQRLHDNQP